MKLIGIGDEAANKIDGQIHATRELGSFIKPDLRGYQRLNIILSMQFPRAPMDREGQLELSWNDCMTKLCDVNQAAKDKLPPVFAEKSGIGSHYVDAFIKPMNTKLPDGTRVGCKRKGLKITLAVGTKKGEGLMRRLEVGKDPIVMLSAALQEAAKAAGVELKISNTEIFVAG